MVLSKHESSRSLSQLVSSAAPNECGHARRIFDVKLIGHFLVVVGICARVVMIIIVRQTIIITPSLIY